MRKDVVSGKEGDAYEVGAQLQGCALRGKEVGVLDVGLMDRQDAP